MRKLVLFDFDGTLTYKDSFLEFIKFYHGSFKFYLGFAWHLPSLVLFKLKIIPNWKAKELIISHFFRGEDLEKFNKIGDTFASEEIPKMLRPKAEKKLAAHIEAGDEIYLVSASCENWLASWCKDKGIGLIATRLEVVNGQITGKIDGKNCYGPEKEYRVREVLDLNKYADITAYGDSSGDKELL
ncbi:HAD-IB family hydrolase, partial [Fulvivirga sp. RKSG066]|uniref:HAD-IB family hydrolase n=1 Tax=Fulvivirga aurantia TaxID=2529383 RepID=UPI001627F46F|nr:HAD-IB family hydrolase [Fulvivirga aurantia]